MNPAMQGPAVPPKQSSGTPSRVQHYVVEVVNSDGTVNARQVSGGRAGRTQLPYPAWYQPAIGDFVLVADVNGDIMQSHIVAPVSTSTGGAPMVFPGSKGITAGWVLTADGADGSHWAAP
jgi:hypothetical protein